MPQKSSGSSSIRDQQSGETARVTNNSQSVPSLNTLAEITGPISVTIDGAGLTIITAEPNSAMSQTFQDIINVTGAGFLGGFKFRFSNTVTNVRVEIDGEEAFDINTEFLRSLNFVTFTQTGMNRWFGAQQSGEFEFFPPQFINYSTSLKVQVRKTVPWNVNLTRYLVIYK